MNNNKSIDINELQRDLATKDERLAIVGQSKAEASKRKEECKDKLNCFGRARFWLNERRAELTSQRQALGALWATKINAGARDIAAGAAELRLLIDNENLLAVVNREIVEVQEPAARDALLVANLDFASYHADEKIYEADIHSLKALAAAQSLGELEGSVEFKGQRSQELARVVDLAIQDRESARQALEREREAQGRLREKTTRPIRWTNPA